MPNEGSEQRPELGPERAHIRDFIGRVMDGSRGNVWGTDALARRAEMDARRAEELSGEQRADALMGVADLRRAEARFSDGLGDPGRTATALAQTYDTLNQAAEATDDSRVRSEIADMKHEAVGMARQYPVLDWVESHPKTEGAATLERARREDLSFTGFEHTLAAHQRISPSDQLSMDVALAANAQLNERPPPRDDVERRDLAEDRGRLWLSTAQGMLAERRPNTFGRAMAWGLADQARGAFEEAGQDARTIQALKVMEEARYDYAGYEEGRARGETDPAKKEKRMENAERFREDARAHAAEAQRLSAVVFGEAG